MILPQRAAHSEPRSGVVFPRQAALRHARYARRRQPRQRKLAPARRARPDESLDFGAPWGDEPPLTRLVLIGEELDEAALHRQLWACRAGAGGSSFLPRKDSGEI